MNLQCLGWTPSLATDFTSTGLPGCIAGRVAAEHRDRYVVLSEQGEAAAEITGRLRYAAASRLELPTVGDWVVLQPCGDGFAVIHSVLPRRTLFLRKVPGELTEPQPVSANVDVVFVVTDSEADFSPRRIERYLLLTRESGAEPAIVINKADLRPQIEELVRSASAVSGGARVLAASAQDGTGLGEMASLLEGARTGAFIGSSGVGKSSLINALLGETTLRTTAVREWDGKGRHTTTSRQLLVLPGGGIVIDTPGMREVQLWAEEESLGAAFPDIEELAAGCRFSDCRHQEEPGCAVLLALENGELAQDRYESYRKLCREIGRASCRERV